MQNTLEITKIIEGALSGDHLKVVAYAEQLVNRLRDTGDEKDAKRVEQTLARFRDSSITTSRSSSSIAPLPVDGDSRLALADEIDSGAYRGELILAPTQQQCVARFVKMIENAEVLNREGVGISPTMLLYGPPGCGKSATASWIASQLKLPLVVARIDALVSSYLGNTARNIRNLFLHAQSRKCVLFLDELDAIAKLRDDQHELGELKRVVISLLQNIDSLNGGTILLAASNHQHLLDSAVWRRFAYKLEIPLPNVDERRRLLFLFLGDRVREDCLPLLVEMSRLCSGADIQQVAEDSIRDAVLNGERSVNLDSLLLAFATRQRPELSGMATPEQKVHALYRLSKEAFPYSRLARLFGLSTATISRLLRKGIADA